MSNPYRTTSAARNIGGYVGAKLTQQVGRAMADSAQDIREIWADRRAAEARYLNSIKDEDLRAKEARRLQKKYSDDRWLFFALMFLLIIGTYELLDRILLS